MIIKINYYHNKMNEISYTLDDFDYEISNNTLIVKRKEIEVSADLLSKTDLTYSIILSATTNEGIYPTSYKGILDILLCNFTAKKLKEISLFTSKIKDGEYEYDGYYYLEKLNISYITLSSNDSKKEILNLLNHLDIKMELKIKLNNNRIIIFNYN